MDASGPGGAASERRLVTVLFADLVGSTDLAAVLDPEDLRDLVDACFHDWRGVIEAHGGVVEKLIGDALMAVFGVRDSEDDDAHRAVRAGLAMRDGLPALRETAGRRFGAAIGIRVGIDSGEVVATPGAERDFRVVGATVNRAARLQSAAPIDGVLVSASTRRLVRGGFAYRASQALVLKGFAEPVEAAEVISERPPELTLDSTRGVEGVTTSLVGRGPELRLLQDRFLDVIDEQALRVVTLVGEAGIGKSRLLGELDAWLAEHPVRFYWFRGRASHGGRSHANALARSVMAHRLRLAEDDRADVILHKLRTGFRGAWDGDDSAADLVGAWLGYDLGGSVPSDARTLRTEATEALAGFFRRLASRQPVVILLEDLHWADDGSLGFLDDAVDLLGGSAVLVVATARATFVEERPRWGEGIDAHERITLRALSRRETRDLAAQLLRRIPDVPSRVLEQLVSVSEGNPFYLEELVTWLLDTGVIDSRGDQWRLTSPVESLALPTSLRGVLQSRLDALPADRREVIQRAAVVGRVFWDAAVAHLESGEATSLEAPLSDLHRRELVQQREFSAFDRAREYVFSHALVRDVAYGSVLRSVRRVHHARVADWLASTSSAVGRGDEYAAPIAEHLDRAEHPDAGAWYLRAARRSLSVFALEEARRLVDRARALADEDGERFEAAALHAELEERTGDPAALEADVAELDRLAARLAEPPIAIRAALVRCRALNAVNRYDDSVAAGREAVRLARAIGAPADEAEALLWIGKSLTWAGDADGARESLDESVERAREMRLPLVEGEAIRYLSMVANNLGRFPEALELVERARQVFADAGDGEGQGACLSQQGVTLFNLDRVDEALASFLQALPVFRSSGHRLRAATIVSNLGVIAESRGELADALRYAREAIPDLRRSGDLESLSVTMLTVGAVAAATGDSSGAVDAFESALEMSQPGTTAAIDGRRRLALLALDVGDLAAARARIDGAIAEAEAGTSSLERANVALAEGWILLAERDARAEEEFRRAGGMLDDLGVDSHHPEVQAGGAAAVARSDPRAAVALIDDLVEGDGVIDPDRALGTLNPEGVLAALQDVLDRADDPRRGDFRLTARRIVEAMADRIGDPELARGYLSSRPVAAILGW